MLGFGLATNGTLNKRVTKASRNDPQRAVRMVIADVVNLGDARKKC